MSLLQKSQRIRKGPHWESRELFYLCSASHEVSKSTRATQPQVTENQFSEAKVNSLSYVSPKYMVDRFRNSWIQELPQRTRNLVWPHLLALFFSFMLALFLGSMWLPLVGEACIILAAILLSRKPRIPTHWSHQKNPSAHSHGPPGVIAHL